MITEVNNKPVCLRNTKALQLVKLRAIKEGRSASNALAQTVIEALNKTDNIAGVSYISIAKAAQIFEYSKRHICRLCATGKIKEAIKRGGYWRIPASEDLGRKRK